MTEPVKPRPQPPQGAAASKPGEPAKTGPQRTISNPEAFKAMSAARMAQVKTKEEPKGFGERVKSLFADLGLNALAVLKELGEDFKKSDKFFKYKLLIIAIWVALSVTGFVVACPGDQLGANNSLDAKLTIAQVVGEPVYSLKNESGKPWTDVMVIANGNYRLAVEKVEANDMLTFEVKRLTGPGGKPAPKDLQITELKLKTNEGKSTLIKDGQPLE